MSDRPLTSAIGEGLWPGAVASWARMAVAGIVAELERQSPRAFVWLVAAFGGGIILFFTWLTDPPVWLGPLGIVAAGGVALAARRWRGVRGLAFYAMAVAAGHTAADLRSHVIATPVLTRNLTAQEIHGRVVSAEFRPTTHRVVLDRLTVPGLLPNETPVRVRVTIPAKNGLPKVGDRITVRAVLRRPLRPTMPDGFDFQRALYFAQIGATGFTFGAWTVEQAVPDALADRLRARLQAIRRHVAARVRTAIPDTGDATTTAALIMGEQTAIPADLQDAYRKSGLAHLLSISGVHMSLLAAAVFFVIRRGLALIPALTLRVDTKKIAAWVALGATTLYVLISGLSVPAVRSFLMIGVVLVAILLDRTALSLRTIAWAALALMAIYPEAVIGASFQMSFMAVLSLIALAEYVRLRVRWRGPEGEFQPFRAAAIIFLGLVVTDIAASGSTALYAIYHFNRFPTYSMVSNFFAGPITGLWVMPWGLIAMLAMPFDLDQVPLKLMGEGVGVVNDIARTVANWPGAQVHVSPMSPLALAVGSFGLLVICLWRGRLRYAGFAFLALAFLQPWFAKGPDVLMDTDAKVVAISDAGGAMLLRPGRGEKFTREIWQDRYGASAEAWSADGAAVADLRCDRDGCILSRDGRKILLAFSAAALAEDCAQVDAAVSFIPGRAFCGRTPLADLFDVRRQGAVALRTNESGVEMRYALDRAGDRRWAAKPPRRVPSEPTEADAPDAAAESDDGN